MLSERLKERQLFTTEEEVDNAKRQAALNMLEDCVSHLVVGMKTIENMKLLPREDIEDYVISYLEAFEKRFYSLDEDEFDIFLSNWLHRRR